jgi:hypothetical protein
VHTTRPHITKLALVSYCAVLSAIYVFALVNAPLSLLSAARHDDGLFIDIGGHLAALHWLGPYDQFTLAKGPGYPAFLALSHLLGLSSSLARALFHCGAVALFVALCHRYLRSYLLAAILFTVLLWDPASFLGQNLRVLRDTIYYGQVLVAFGLLAHSLLGRKPGVGLIAGLMLGWVWLTREEGLWIAPGLVMLAAGGLYRAVVERGALRFAAAALVAFAAFGAVNATFRAINWKLYGTPVGVEYKEPNFVRAIGAIHSVRSGEVKPFVSVTRATRQKIYPVSPSFAELGPYLDGEPGERWEKAVCDTLHRETCGEIGGAVFAWALRDAAARAGYHQSPAAASAFYGKIANEIGAACDNKQLECERQFFSELPPYTSSQLATVPQRVLDAIVMVLSARSQSVDGVPSLGGIDQFRSDLRFLNFPFMAQPERATRMLYALRGWYYRPSGGWIAMTVSDNGRPAAVSSDRMASPDLVTAFKDPAASNQRFELQTFCSGTCVLRMAAEDGQAIERALADVTPGEVALGNGRINFDAAASELGELFGPERRNTISYRVRQTVIRNFEFVRVPLLVIGLIAAFGCLVWWRRAILNPAYVLGLTMWALAASRILLLALLDAMFYALTINPVYLAPTGFAMTAAAVLSIAAWLQLRGEASRRLRGSAATPQPPLQASA